MSDYNKTNVNKSYIFDYIDDDSRFKLPTDLFIDNARKKKLNNLYEAYDTITKKIINETDIFLTTFCNKIDNKIEQCLRNIKEHSSKVNRVFQYNVSNYINADNESAKETSYNNIVNNYNDVNVYSEFIYNDHNTIIKDWCIAQLKDKNICSTEINKDVYRLCENGHFKNIEGDEKARITGRIQDLYIRFQNNSFSYGWRYNKKNTCLGIKLKDDDGNIKCIELNLFKMPCIYLIDIFFRTKIKKDYLIDIYSEDIFLVKVNGALYKNTYNVIDDDRLTKLNHVIRRYNLSNDAKESFVLFDTIYHLNKVIKNL